MAPVSEFLHPLLYKGAKDEENMQSVLGSLVPVWFKLGPLSEENGPLAGLKYGDVTEKQGRILVKRFPEVFAWPEGTSFTGPQTVSRDEYEAVLGRLDALEGALADLRGVLAGKASSKPNKAKEVPDAVAG